MKTRVFIWIVLSLSLSVFADGDFFVSGSIGYTHYEAQDLNKVMVALERQSAEAAGLNRYAVDNFNGHPRQAWTLGYAFGAKKQHRVSLEAESWVEDFHQDLVPFYMNRDLDPRFPVGVNVSCQALLDPSFEPVEGGTAGCIDAREIFTLVPLTLQYSHHWSFSKERLWLGAGFALGVLAGDARIIVATDFIGNDARPDDTLEISLYPGITPTAKLFGELEYKPFRFMSFSLRGSLRHLRMNSVQVKNKLGESFLFGLVLGQQSEINEGSTAYLLENNNESVFILRDKPSAAELRQAELSGAEYNEVAGDFSGWIVEAKITLWWRNPWSK